MTDRIVALDEGSIAEVGTHEGACQTEACITGGSTSRPGGM